MKKRLMILLAVNLLIFGILFWAIQFVAIAMGLGANRQPAKELRLYLSFAAFHYMFNLFLLYQTKLFTPLGVISSYVLITLLYLYMGKFYELF
jgi:hypothetical protein